MVSHAAASSFIALILLLLSACSFSNSSSSRYDSSRASSGSSSSSSRSSGSADQAYREDVSEYARAYAKSGGGDFGAFQADLGRLAEEHGITNWASNLATYTAIGEGLRRAKVSAAALMAYRQNLAGGDPQKAAAIQQGYDSVR